MLHVHRAERSDRLVAALADVLTVPLDDPLATEVIAVHSRGIERWISQELSLRLGVGTLGDDGVCANVEFPFPGRLIRAAVAAGSGIDPLDDPWLPDRLAWPLLDLVAADPRAPMLGPLRHYVGVEDDGDGLARRFGVIRHVADLFDRYGVYRPHMLSAWREGRDIGPDGRDLPDRQRWQPAMWRSVRDHLDLPSFAERHQTALDAMSEDPHLLDLPPRIALFGLTALPASFLAVLTAIAHHRDVHLLLLHPSPDLWDRVRAAAAPTNGGPPVRDRDLTAGLPRHPLLRSWGRDARELQLVAPQPSEPAQQHHHPMGDDAPTTLLQRIQADIRTDQPPAAARATGQELPQLDPADRSVQVHDCHGRLRQVEVLRDAILHLLADVPDLEPRDIIVMCPDIEAFAPLVTAVFGADAVARDTTSTTAEQETPPALRVRLADRALRRTNPVLEVVSLLLELVEGRLAASSVVDLISREPVRRRFRFDDDEVATLETWIAQLQIRWGLDGDHRERHGLPNLEANSWRAGLERLQLGIAMADEYLRLVEGVAPFDDVEGQSSDLAGRLVELVSRLGAAMASLTDARPIDQWRTAIGEAADALTATHAPSAWQRLQLHAILDDLVAEASSGDGVCPVELTFAEVRVLLADRLTGRPSTTGHRTGDLTVCTLVPMRSVPHRVVCVLGLDDGAFPRQAVPDSDDLLQLAPRVGDRDPRSEDRQLLLDALLAATEALVVTYAGRDERTNEPRPPAVPVEELLDVIDRTVATEDGIPARQHIGWSHPLTAHDPRNFQPTRLRHDQKAWGFDPARLEAAQARSIEPAAPPPFLAVPLPLPQEDVIELDDLVAFLQHPIKAFVRQRLDLTLPGEEDAPSDAIPAALKGLDQWKVGEPLVRSWVAGEDQDRALDVLRARGLIPPGDLAGSDLDDIRKRVAEIIRLGGTLDVTPGSRRTVDIEVELPDGRSLTGSILDVQGWQIQSISYSKVGPKHRLATWARFLAANAAQSGEPWTAVTLGRHPWKGPHRAQAVRLSAIHDRPGGSEAFAIEQLERLVELYDRGRQSPIPLYCDTSAKVADNLRAGKDATRYVDKAWRTGDGGWDLEDRDPYHLLVLSRQLPTDTLFEQICDDDVEAGWAGDDRRLVAYAWRLWEPILAAERSRET